MLGGLLEYLRAAGRGRWAAEEEEDEGESKNPALVGLMKNALDMSSGVRRGERARHLPPKEISLAGASPSVLGGAGHFLPWGFRAGFAVVEDDAPSLTGLSASGAGLVWESLCFSVSLRALSDDVVCVPSTDFVALDAGTASRFVLKALSRWSREVILSSNDWLDTSADKSISFKQARKESRSRHMQSLERSRAVRWEGGWECDEDTRGEGVEGEEKEEEEGTLLHGVSDITEEEFEGLCDEEAGSLAASLPPPALLAPQGLWSPPGLLACCASASESGICTLPDADTFPWDSNFTVEWLCFLSSGESDVAFSLFSMPSPPLPFMLTLLAGSPALPWGTGTEAGCSRTLSGGGCSPS